MIKLKNCIVIIIATLSIKLYSQEDTKYSLFWNNYSIFNPAITGDVDRHNYASTNGQISPTGIDSTTLRSFNISYEIRIDSSKNGIGINFQQDKVGRKINNQANLNYAHWIPVGRGDLAAGIAIGFASNNFLNINGGIMYSTSRLRTGIGVTHINHSNYEPLKYNFSKTQNYYFNFQYTLYMAKVDFTPTIFIRSTKSKTDIDLSLIIDINKHIIIGGGYRTSKVILLNLAVPIKKKILISYAYNYVQPNATVLYKSSHEVSLTVLFK